MTLRFVQRELIMNIILSFLNFLVFCRINKSLISDSSIHERINRVELSLHFFFMLLHYINWYQSQVDITCSIEKCRFGNALTLVMK